MDFETVYATEQNTPESYVEYSSFYYRKPQMLVDDLVNIQEEYYREANKLATMMANNVMRQKNMYIQQQKAKIVEDAAVFDILLRQIEAGRKAILSTRSSTKTNMTSVWNKEAHRKKMKELFVY
jgi:hypothetical protein